MNWNYDNISGILGTKRKNVFYCKYQELLLRERTGKDSLNISIVVEKLGDGKKKRKVTCFMKLIN